MSNLKWAQLWKVPFIMYCFLQILNNKVNLLFVRHYLWMSLFLVISAYPITYFFQSLVFVMKGLFFISLYFFFYNDNIDTLEFKLKFSSIFIITSFFPFSFGALPELGQNYDLTSLGFEYSDAIVGLFQKPHTASVVLSYACITALFFALKTSHKIKAQILWFTLFILGIYFQIKTYVRLGVLMTIIGSFYLIYHKGYIKIMFKNTIVIFFLVIVVVYNLNEIIDLDIYSKRLLGANNFEGNSNSSKINYDEVSSGRFSIWFSSLTNWGLNDNIFEIIFGISEEELTNRNLKSIGRKVFSHNLFIDSLVVNGLIGFLFLTKFMLGWHKYVKNKLNDYAKYSHALFYSFLIFAIFQGGPILYEGIFIIISILILKKINLNGFNTSNIK